MKLNRFIVKNDSSLHDDDAMSRVITVMQEALISSTKRGPQYCFATRFSDGIMVFATRRKASHSFVVLGSPR